MNRRRTWSLTLAAGLFLILLATLLRVTTTHAQVPRLASRYVADNGTDAGACTNADAPCRTIQYAVDQATSGDQVLIATGLYTGVHSQGGTTQLVYITKTITLRGGYVAGFVGPPDPAANPTTLDAEGQGRVIYAAGPGLTLGLEGLRITGGTSGPGLEGGGVYLINAAALFVNNVVYSNTADFAGGGIHLASVNATLEANTIQSNTLLAANNYSGGGGIASVDNTHLDLIDNLIRYNAVVGSAAGGGDMGRGGGGLYQRGGSATLVDNTFRENSAFRGGSLYADSGATLSLTHNLFVSNTVTVDHGGALMAFGGDASLQANTILSNTAVEEGGGAYLYQLEARLDGNQIRHNHAQTYGGGLALWIVSATLEANTIQSNTVQAPSYYHGGGGLFVWGSDLVLRGNDVDDNTSGERAGGVYLSSGNATVTGNTFAGNRGLGREGGAIHLTSGTAVVSDNTFRQNEAHWGGGFYGDQGTVTLTHNLFLSNTVGVYNGGAVTLLYGQGWLGANTFTGNTANGQGGAIHFYQADATLRRNLFRDNWAQDEGGALSALGGTVSAANDAYVGNRTTGDGGGLALVGSTARLRHTTLAGNDGAAVWVDSGTVGFTNTLVYSQAVGVDNQGGTVSMTQTLWDSVLTPTLGTVGQAGSFAGAAALAADGYHLTFPSDALGAGIYAGVADDIDGEPRPQGRRPDLGADEYPILTYYLPLAVKGPSTQ